MLKLSCLFFFLLCEIYDNILPGGYSWMSQFKYCYSLLHHDKFVYTCISLISGYANVIQVGGVRIAGCSGIYKGHNVQRGRNKSTLSFGLVTCYQY